MIIPGSGGPSGIAGGHGHGGILVGGSPAGSHSGAPAGGRGGVADSSSAASGSCASAPGKGKQTHVVLDEDEVSSDEDGPLQKLLRQLSGARPAVLDEAAAADKEAVDKRAADEAVLKRAAEEAAAMRIAEERATEETTAKKDAEERAAEEATVKAAAAEAVGAARGSPAPGQAPSAAGAKRAAAPSGSTPLAKHPYRGVWKPQFVQLSLPLFSFFCGFILLLPFLPRSSPSGAAAALGMAIEDAVVRVAPRPALISEPRILEGVPKDVVESEGEPEVSPEAVPEVVQEESPAEGAMIAFRTATAPLLSCGAHTPLSPVPHRATATVVLGHPTPYASGDISVSEVVSMAHQALSQS
jgi:hypothetical protein